MKLRVLFLLPFSLFLFSCNEVNESVLEENQSCNLCHDALPKQANLHELTAMSGYAYDCSLCHSDYDDLNRGKLNEELHQNGRVELSGSGFKVTTNGCSALECHGFGREGLQGIIWTDSATFDEKLDCTGCHQTAEHFKNQSCEKCHTLTAKNEHEIRSFANHINGSLDFLDSTGIEALACGSCHGLPSRNNAHHLATDSSSRGFDCLACHKGFSLSSEDTTIDSNFHMDGKVLLLPDSSYLASLYDFDTLMTIDGTTCSNIVCHGANRKNTSTIEWQRTASLENSLDCRGCHETQGEKKHRNGSSCDRCHTSVAAGADSIKNPLLHMNGTLDF